MLASAPDGDGGSDGPWRRLAHARNGGAASDGGAEPFWARQLREAAERVRQQAAVAAEQAKQGIAQGLEQAQAVDWAERADDVRGHLSRGLERTTSTLQETVAQGMERTRTREWVEQAGDRARDLHRGVSQSFVNVVENATSARDSLQQHLSEAEIVQTAKDNAAAAAGATRGALSIASDRVAGAATFAADPRKMFKFASVAGTGLLMIIVSFYLLILPTLFALLFTTGSILVMSSFVILTGARPLLAQLMRREKLPFSGLYMFSLLGTIWAILLKHSTMWTIIFAVMQAISLLYFLCSFFPGGVQALSMLGRAGGRSARALLAV